MRRFSAFASFVVVALFFVGCAQSSSAPSAPSGIEGSTSLTADQLAGTWKLVSLQQFGQPERPTPASAGYTLILGEDGRLSTRADCNACVSTFGLSGGTFSARPLACTRAACPTMEFESLYTSLLTGDSTVMLSGERLALSSGRGILRFSR